ncbi:MAG: hypothetical protein IJX80_02810 [Clostridia bacterium]|nr:hypothetical protein [Clostridia bacterium]
MSNPKNEKLDIIIPISLDAVRKDATTVENEILELKEKYGFSKFAVSAPEKGCRSTHYPSRSHFEDVAARLLKIKNDLTPQEIEIGWWITTTLKSGPSEAFDRPIKADGSESRYASCPADPRFRRRFCDDLAYVTRIVKPSFVITEDDLSIHATTFSGGCFCRHHLDGFAAKEGKYYSREELVARFAEKTADSYVLMLRYREYMKETLVTLAHEMRAALDIDSPEIPLGYMQAGGADWDGDCTEAVARAMAGERHTPFSRLYGTFYCGGDTKDIPKTLYHAIYTKQHIGEPFRFYHESDSYPHIRYFTSASQMRALMAISYAHGFDGSTFQVQQLLDDANEETAYGRMLVRARAKLEEIHRVAKQCTTHGVEICYDPFWNTATDDCKQTEPLWAKPVGLFGIPYVTTEADVAFWDVRQAKYADDETVMRYLSKGLFLDGEAAHALCERGYGKHLGVAVGEQLAVGDYRFDLGAKERIREEFSEAGRGRLMQPAHTYAAGREGRALRLTPIDPCCEIVSEEFTFEKKLVSVSMTRFDNTLGGRVTVMGTVLDGNGSAALYNYRRQRLLQRLVSDYRDVYAFVKDVPATYLVMNETTDRETSGFFGMLTLINLCDDTAEGFALHLPPHWRDATEFCILDRDGTWKAADCTRTADGISVAEALHYCEPLCILVR